MNQEEMYKMVPNSRAFIDESRSALDVSMFSTGLFAGAARSLSGVDFIGQDEIDLLNYGTGERLPEAAGFRFAMYSGRDATAAHTNLYRGGCFTDPSGPDVAFVMTGLAARIGRPRLLNIDTGEFEYAEWIDKCQLTIREAIAESTSIAMTFKRGLYQYPLGALISRPLMGAIYGPNAGLLDEVGNPQPEEERPDQPFVPFRVMAITRTEAPAGVSLRRNPIHISSDGSWPREDGTVLVPVTIWIFGYPHDSAVGACP